MSDWEEADMARSRTAPDTKPERGRKVVAVAAGTALVVGALTLVKRGVGRKPKKTR